MSVELHISGVQPPVLEATNLGLRFSFPFRVRLANKIEIFFIEEFFFLTLCALALLLLLPLASFTLVGIVAFFVFFIFVDDETFPNLYRASQ